ncbi:MAG TPA: hypothetical protein VF886_06825 [Roseiarcus sp.]
MALAFPHFKDQWLRFRERRAQRDEATGRWPGFWRATLDDLGARRREYDGWDSLILALGAVALIASFLLKAWSPSP